MVCQLVALLCASYAVAAEDASGAAAAVLDLHVVVPNAHADEFIADGSITRPFTSVHAANNALARCGQGCSASVSLHPGTHTLGSQGPLRLTGDGKQRWVGLRGQNGERAILSGGEQLKNWTEVVPGRWRAPLPSGAAAKTLRIGSERALQATFPNGLAWPPKLRWLYVENFKMVNNSLSEVSVQEPSNLPREYHTWGNGTPGALVAYVFPASSWVGLRVEATPIQGK